MEWKPRAENWEYNFIRTEAEFAPKRLYGAGRSGVAGCKDLRREEPA